MSKAYENLIKALSELESERVKERIKEHAEKRPIVPYIRVGSEEQLEKLDRMFAKGIIDDQEYIEMRARLRGDRNA